MKRRNFFKALVTLIVAPSILTKIDFDLKATQKITKSIFDELNFVVPEYYPQYIEKYGEKSYLKAMESSLRYG